MTRDIYLLHCTLYKSNHTVIGNLPSLQPSKYGLFPTIISIHVHVTVKIFVVKYNFFSLMVQHVCIKLCRKEILMYTKKYSEVVSCIPMTAFFVGMYMGLN